MRRFRVTIATPNGDEIRVVNLPEKIPVPDGGLERVAFFGALLNLPRPEILRMIETIHPEILYRYLTTYYGNGCWSAPYWGIGLSPAPGGAQVRAEGIQSVRSWHALGGGNFIEPNLYWLLMNQPNPLVHHVNAVWRALIRIVRANLNHAVGNNWQELGDYVADYFLRDTLTAWVDIFPLLRANEDQHDWPYDDIVPLEEYLGFRNRRIEFIANKILEFRPTVVVCMGLGHQNDFMGLAGGAVWVPNQFHHNGNAYNYHTTVLNHPPSGGQNQMTRLFIIPQPVAQQNYEFYDQLL